MIKLRTKSEYSQRLKNEGLQTGKFIALIHEPDYKQGNKIVTVKTEYFFEIEKEVNVGPANEEKLEKIKVPVLMLANTPEYFMKDFDATIVKHQISKDIAEEGMTGAMDFAYSQIAVLEVKYGGEKQTLTYGIDPNDWEVVVEKPTEV